MILDQGLIALKRIQAREKPKTSAKEHLLNWLSLCAGLVVLSIIGWLAK